MYTKEAALTRVEQTLLAQPETLTAIDEMFDVDLLEQIGRFEPHPETEAITDETLEWVNTLGFLTEQNREQIRAWARMNPFAHHGKRNILKVTGENYGSLYLMDDWIANDTQETHLDLSQKKYLFQLVMQLTGQLDRVAAEVDPWSVQYEIPAFQSEDQTLLAFAEKSKVLFNACWQSFLDVCSVTDREYAIEYARILREHIMEALKPQDEGILETLDLPEYLATRRKVSGMKVGRKLTELTTGSFTALRALRLAHQDQPTLKNIRVFERIHQLEECLEDFGGLGNDVFSVSKEVFRDGTIFNFVAIAVLALSQSRDDESLNYLDLQAEALGLTRAKLRELSQNFSTALHGDTQQLPHLFAEIDTLTAEDLGVTAEQLEEHKTQLKAYAQGLMQYFLATYCWELSPDGGLLRYQHEHAPFAQLRTAPSTVVFEQSRQDLPTPAGD